MESALPNQLPTTPNIQTEPHQYEVFFKNASIGIMVMDFNGNVKFSNPYFLTLFGYEEKEVMGKSIEILIPQSYHRDFNQYRKNYIDQKRSKLKAIGLDLMALKKDGTEFPVEISLGNYGPEEHEHKTLTFSI